MIAKDIAKAFRAGGIRLLYPQQKCKVIGPFSVYGKLARLPFAERAEVSIDKLRDFCLNPFHEQGKHKAKPLFSDQYGQRYVIDFAVEWQRRRAIVHSGWILEHGSERPRLTTCFVI